MFIEDYGTWFRVYVAYWEYGRTQGVKSYSRDPAGAAQFVMKYYEDATKLHVNFNIEERVNGKDLGSWSNIADFAKQYNLSARFRKPSKYDTLALSSNG